MVNTRIIATAASLIATSAVAEQLRYVPVNPSFGGSALNSSHLLSIANAQKAETARDANEPASSTVETGNEPTDADRFVSQLQSRMFSALSSQVAEAIFGTNPQDNGTVTFGDTTIVFDRTTEAINLTITDFGTGTVTEIVVPQLVTN